MGLRERKKATTREALYAAALRLFAERGFRDTTVTMISGAANVSERTFYRYFTSKEDVALKDVMRAFPKLELAIKSRPPSEAPLRAILNAFLAIAESSDAPQLALLYSGPPLSWSTAKPLGTRTFVGLESSLANALLARPGDPGEPEDARRYRMLLAARTGLVAFRTALARYHELGGIEAVPAERFVELVREAFTVVEDGCRAPTE